MMQKKYLIAICFSILFLSACERINRVDNTGIIRTPYVLFTGGLDGQAHRTNDANYFTRMLSIAQHPVRQIITADTNILLLRKHCYVSDNADVFNIVNSNCLDYFDEFYRYYRPNQMCYDKSEKIVYLCTKGGLLESSDLGKTFTPTGLAGVPISVIEDDNGDIYAIQNSASLSKRTGGVFGWSAVTQTTALPAANNFYLSSFDGALIATDYEGEEGIFQSTNGGVDWSKLSGVSNSGRHILFTNQPDGTNDLYMGRDSAGLFKLINNKFEFSGIGIPATAKVGFVQGKKITYRTGEVKEYLFCATDVGLYVSESNGDDWYLARPSVAAEYSTLK